MPKTFVFYSPNLMRLVCIFLRLLLRVRLRLLLRLHQWLHSRLRLTLLQPLQQPLAGGKSPLQRQQPLAGGKSPLPLPLQRRVPNFDRAKQSSRSLGSVSLLYGTSAPIFSTSTPILCGK